MSSLIRKVFDFDNRTNMTPNDQMYRYRQAVPRSKEAEGKKRKEKPVHPYRLAVP